MADLIPIINYSTIISHSYALYFAELFALALFSSNSQKTYQFTNLDKRISESAVALSI